MMFAAVDIMWANTKYILPYSAAQINGYLRAVYGGAFCGLTPADVWLSLPNRGVVGC